MMKFNDQQLSDILKQVQLPSDLKAQLRKIPQQESLTESSASQVAVDLSRDLPKSRFGRTRALGWLSLATTAGLLFGLMWTNTHQRSKDPQIGFSTRSNSETGEDSENRSLACDTVPMSRRINVESLTVVQLQSEINEIEKRFDAINSNRPPTIGYRLDVNEYTSLVIATASQTAILSGVSIEYLRSDLEESVQRFPETRGSTIAAQLLASADAQN